MGQAGQTRGAAEGELGTGH